MYILSIISYNDGKEFHIVNSVAVQSVVKQKDFQFSSVRN